MATLGRSTLGFRVIIGDAVCWEPLHDRRRLGLGAFVSNLQNHGPRYSTFEERGHVTLALVTLFGSFRESSIGRTIVCSATKKREGVARSVALFAVMPEQRELP